MANVINTRIQLKYDSLSNWNASTFKPLKGEVCVAKVDVTQPENSLLQPIMFKVGDGDHTFAELGWTSAKAADVYAWAKAAELPVDDTLATEGKFVVGFDWEGDKLVPKFRDFVTEINETNKDKLDAPTTKAVKTYVDGKIADVVAQGTVVAAGDGIDVVQSGNTYTVSHENTSDVADVTAAARTYITGLTFDEFGHVTGTTVGTEEDQDLSNYKTKQAVVEETGAANQTLKISQNENGVITTEAVDIAITSAQVTDLDTGVHAVSLASGTNNGTVKLTVDGQATDNIAVTGLGSAAFTDSTAYAPQATTYTKTEVDGLVKTAKEAADAAQGTANETKAKVDTFFGILSDDTSDIVDTLAEINANITENTDAFTGLSGRVTNIENGTTIVPKAGNADTLDYHDSTYFATAEGLLSLDETVAKMAIAPEEGGTGVAYAAKAGEANTATTASKVENALKIQYSGSDIEEYNGDEEVTIDLSAYQPAGDYKTKQTAVVDPTANGTAKAFIDSITQNENGEIVVTKKNMSLPRFYYQETRGLTFGDDKIELKSSDLSFGYGTNDEGYQDSNGGILGISLNPIGKTKLDEDVKTSLGLADTAIQSDDLAEIATTGSIYDVKEGAYVSTGKDDPENTEYLIFNCGSATTII